MKKGFTIVELLIVIVVIGILAAIVIVAYQGIQVRARNAQTITVAQGYIDALTRYGVVTNTYPFTETGMTAGVCLGTGYPADHCWISTVGNGDYYTNAAFDTLLKDYISTKPTVSAKYYDITPNDQRAGVVYIRSGFKVTYYLDGKGQDCKLSSATASNQGTANPTTVCSVLLPSL